MAKNTKAHYDENPDKVKKRANHYAKLKKSAGGSYSAEDINAIRDKLNDQCAYCMTDLKGSGEIDHMLPISRGGNNDASNLTLSCRACNRDKHNKTSAEFIVWRKNLNLPLNIHFIKYLLNM
jgi:5-methylcytosine-specific restriction endonuclease McrA